MMVTVVPKSAENSCVVLADSVISGEMITDDELTNGLGHNDRRVRREIANSNERKRMQSINAGFQSLRLLLPHSTAADRLSKAAILQQAVEYISYLSAEREQLLELNRQYLAATRCYSTTGPIKQRKCSSDGELSDDASVTSAPLPPQPPHPVIYDSDWLMTERRYKRRLSPINGNRLSHSRNRRNKKKYKAEMSVTSSDELSRRTTSCQVTSSTRDHPSSVSRRNLATIVEAIRHLEGDRFPSIGADQVPAYYLSSQSGHNSDADDCSVSSNHRSSVIYDPISYFPDTPEDLSVLNSRFCVDMSTADKYY